MNLDDFKHLLSHLDIRAESKRPLEATEDANLRRFKDKWLFLVTLLLILGAFIGLVSFVMLRPDSPQTGIAINSGMGLVMALSGYYVRGKNN